MMFRVFFIFCIVLFVLGIVHSSVEKVKQLRVSSCIEVWMTKHVSEDGDEWYVYAGNRCWDSVEFPHNIRIKRAYNLTIDSGLILDTKGFIVPARGRKLIFMSFSLSSGVGSILLWELVD